MMLLIKLALLVFALNCSSLLLCQVAAGDSRRGWKPTSRQRLKRFMDVAVLSV